MKRQIVKTIAIALILILGINTGCEKLEVENSNQPDKERVLNSPDDVKNLVQASFLSFWQAIKDYNINMTADVIADHSTVSWGNFAWRAMSIEPRASWNNDPSYGDADMTENLWYALYGSISQVNDALQLILAPTNPMQIGVNGADNKMVEATGYFIRGVALGHLGLVFDQALIPYHDSDLSNLVMKPWNEVLEAAVEELAKAVAVCNANTFTWGAGAVNGMTINNTYLAQLANSYAARFLTMGARTKAQNDNLSWTTKYTWANVVTFANAGITVDFAPEGQGLPWDGGSWYDLNIKYLRQDGWGRVDCRVINLLDPLYPVRYPTDQSGLATLGAPNPHNLTPAGQAVSSDLRFAVDFEFKAANDFRPERGGWHFSHYRHSRYDFPATTSTEGLFMGESRGPLRELRAYEVQLMKAEALARSTGNYTGAAAILNNASLPRKSRGGLADVAATEVAVHNAIFYERQIELFHNGFFMAFSDMRRKDMLQYGTPLHFPVPGKELGVLNIPIYSFGGVTPIPDGINTSNKGQWIWPFYHFTFTP